MSDVFISYSRRDSEFMRRLHSALSAQNRDIWVDWEDIPATADWWNEIRGGIDAADTFVFIISPDSAISDVCYREIEYAVSARKRFIPILHRKLTGEEATPTGKKLHPAISSHNWIYFQDTDDFDKAFKSLQEAIETDLAHVREHTRLLLRAREWERQGRGSGSLLDSAEVERAEAWLSQAAGKKPEPTDLHTAYIVASRAAQARRQRRLLLSVSVAFVIAIALAIFGLIQSQVAISNANKASTAQVVAQFQADLAQTQAVLAQHNAETATIAQGQAQVAADDAQTQAARAQNEANSNATAQAVAQREAYNAATQAAAATIAQGQAQIAADDAQTQAARAQNEADSNATAQFRAQAAAYEAATQAAAATLAQGQAEISANNAQTQAAIAQREADSNATAQAVALDARATAQISAYDAQTQAARAQTEADGNATAQSVAQQEAYNASTAQARALVEADRAATQAAIAQNNAVTATVAQGQALFLAVTAQAAQGTAVYNEQHARAQSLTVNGEQLLDAGYPDLAISLAIEASKLDPSLTGAQRLLNRAGPETVRLNFVGASQTEQEQYRDSSGRTQTRDVEVYAFDGLFDPSSTLLVNSPDGTSLSIIDLASRKELYRLIGHSAWVTAAVFSPDSKYLVSGDEDGDIIVWDVATGTLLRHLSGHTSRINSLTYSPDEQEVVSGSDDKSATIWNVDSGAVVFSLPGFGAAVTKTMFNDSGSAALAFALDQDTPKVGRLTAGGNPNRSFSNLGQYRGFNPKGTLGYMGGDGSGYLTLWRTDQLQQVREFKLGNAKEDYIPQVAFSPNGKWVLVYVENRAYSNRDTFTVSDRFLELWDIATGESIYRLNLNEPDPNGWSVYSLAFSSDSNQALIGGLFGRTNTLMVWDINRRRELRRFTGHNHPITKVVFSPDSHYAFSSAENNTRVWDINDRETVMSGRVDVANSKISTIALGMAPLKSNRLPINPVPVDTSDPNGTVQWPVAFGYTQAGTINTWNLATGENVIVPINVGSSPLAFSPTQAYAIVAGRDATNEFSGLRLWDVTNAQYVWEEIVRQRVEAVTFAGDGQQVALGGYLPFFPGDGQAAQKAYSLIVWDTENRTTLQTISMPDDLKTVPIAFVALSYDGQFAATVSRVDDETQTLILWDVTKGTEYWRVTDFAAPINAIAFNPNGRTLAIALGQTANRVDIWDIESGEGVLTLIGHTNSVNTMAFSPDGETLVTGSEDRSIIQWDMSNGQVLRHFPEVTSAVDSVAFSADGRLAVSASEKDGILIWRIETLQETIDWTFANRYVIVLSCLQRAQYNVQPLCLDGVVPTATATGTLPPSATPTITPTPTVTPTATATAIPYGYISSTKSVNFRSGPGTGFQTLRGLVPRTTFIVLGVEEDWTHILLEDDTDGWVSSGVVVMGVP